MLEVGFGAAVITPPTPVQLAGFIEDQPATEVHDDLEVRAMFVRGELGAVCLLVCDLLGMSPSFARPVRESVAAALGLERRRRADVVRAHPRRPEHDRRQRGARLGDARGLPRAARRAVHRRGARAAAATAVPASLRAGGSPLPDGLSINRRGLPYDPTFAVLDAIAPDGTRVGTLANVSIHPVALGPECLAVSSDWVGPFRTALQARAGGTTVLLSGALGDVNPHHVHRQHNDCRGDGFAEADQLGRDVAEAVDARAVRHGGRRGDGPDGGRRCARST